MNVLGENLEEFDDSREEAMNLIREYKAAQQPDYLKQGFEDSNEMSFD